MNFYYCPPLKSLSKFLFILVWIVLSTSCHAQEQDSVYYKVVLKNGEEYLGYVTFDSLGNSVKIHTDQGVKQFNLQSISSMRQVDIRRNDSFVRMDTVYSRVVLREGGQLYGYTVYDRSTGMVKVYTSDLNVHELRRDAIKRIYTVKDRFHQKLRRDRRQDNFPHHKYFVVPNAIPLDKNTGYYQNTFLGISHFAYGLTDRITLSGGGVPIVLIAGGLVDLPFWIHSKLGHPIIEDQLYAGIGLSYVQLYDEFKILQTYGLLTFGDKNKNLSLQMGNTYDLVNDVALPTLSLSMLTKLSKHSAVYVESTVLGFGRSKGLFSFFGMRLLWNGFVLEYGAMASNNLDDIGAIFVPIINCIWPFDKLRKGRPMFNRSVAY